MSCVFAVNCSRIVRRAGRTRDRVHGHLRRESSPLLLVPLALLCWLGSALSDPAPAFLGKWGSPGTGDGQFDRLGGIAVDRDGNLYAADLYANRIQKFSPSGSLLLKWGSYGSGPGRFWTPTDVAVDATGNVYVADLDNRRIQKFTSGGTYLTEWTLPYGSLTAAPLYVTAGPDGNVYATASSLVYKFDSVGNQLARWGDYGTGPGEFFGPAYGITTSASYVYVVDHYGDRVERFGLDGTFISAWSIGVPGTPYGALTFGVATDSIGNVLVSTHWTIQKFDFSGTLLCYWGNDGYGDGEFGDPVDLAVGPTGIIYVADSIRNDVQLFSNPPTPTRNMSWGQLKNRFR